MQQQQEKQTKYCGFLCSEITEKQQAIADEILDFSTYNPEFALVMNHRLTKILYKSEKDILMAEEMKRVQLAKNRSLKVDRGGNQ